MKRMNKRTLYGFLWGVGSLGNISGDYVEYDQLFHKSDCEALMNDWKAVGNDMKKVMSSMSI